MNSVLTIDDAPSSHIRSKLEILDKLKIKCVFFCEGRKIQKRKKLVKNAIEEGHIVGNHSWSHPHFSDLTFEEASRQISKTDSLIGEIYDETEYNRSNKVFRFPFGDRGKEEHVDQIQEVLSDLNYRFPKIPSVQYEWMSKNWKYNDWYWTLNDKSYNAEDYNELMEIMEDQLNPQDSGDIVIYHDHEDTHAWFEDYLRELRSRGLKFADPKDLCSA